MTSQVTSDQVFAFACRVSWAPEWGESIYNRQTAGQAKYEHYLSVHESWENTQFTDIRVRKVGAPHSSERFIENAKYRGMPGVRCGQRVNVRGVGLGTIVGHNSSANFDVLFDRDARHPGMTLNCHPMEIELCQSN